MHLQSIEIHGFRGFKNKAKINLAIPDNISKGSGLTILTGPNNSGKFSVIECLRARSGHTNPSFSIGMRNSSVDQVEIVFNFSNATKKISSISKGSSETYKDSNKEILKNIFTLPSRRAFRAYFNKHYFSREDFINNSGNIFSQRQPLISEFEYRLFNILKDNNSKNNFNSLLEEVLGTHTEWSIDQSDEGNHFLKFYSANHSHSSNGLGEGIVSIFAIIDSLYDSNPSDIIVIDEPELSLHPALQKRLAKLFLRFSKDRQIIISTHSPYFVDLNAISAGAKLIRVISGDEGTQTYQLDKTSVEAIKKLSNGNLYNLHVFGLDARELFFQEEGIILIEGQEDVLLLPKVAEQLGHVVKGNFFGWGAGGAGNIQHLCQILQTLGFNKVIAIVDGDQDDKAKELKKLFPMYLILSIPAEDIRTKPARKATSQVIGLLDEDKIIRKELKEETKEIFNEIEEYLASQIQ